MAANKRRHANAPSVLDVDITPPPPPTADEKDPRGLQERAVLVRTTTSEWHGIGADHTITEDVRSANDSNGQDIGVFSKRKMDKRILAPIKKVIRDWRQWEREHTMAWADRGTRLLSIETFFVYKKEAAKAVRSFDLAVDELCKVWPQAVEQQKQRLKGKLWRASDYPSVEQLRAMFSLRVLVEPIPTGDDFRIKLSKEEAEEIRRSYDAEQKARLKGAVRDVFDRMNEVVTELRDKLADADVNVRKGSFESLRKLVAVLPQLNVAVQDPNIANLGNQIARELLAVDAGEVNDDQGVRNEVAKKADKLLAALKPLRQNWNQGASNGDSN